MLLSNCPMTTPFSDWLLQELEEREWTQADLSRKSGVSTGQITRVVNGQRGLGKDSLTAIAKALNYPPEQVYRVAGFLPPAINIDEDIEKILHELSKLPKPDQQEVLAYIRMKNNLRKKK